MHTSMAACVYVLFILLQTTPQSYSVLMLLARFPNEYMHPCIQTAAGSVTRTDAIPKTSAVHRQPITPPPNKRNSGKIKDQTTVKLKDAQVSLTDTEHLLHNEGQMTIQVIAKMISG